MPEMPRADDALRAALHGVRGLLLDLDGVLVLAGKAIAGAPEAMAELDRRAMPYLLVTNTSLVSRPSLAAWGRSVGFATPPDRLQSALSASAELVRREYGDRPVFVIASDDARAEFAGLNVIDAAGVKDAAPGSVAAVVLGDSPDQLTKANLDLALRLVRSGAELIGMHRNPWWITPEGPTLDAGAFLVALEWATGRRARTVGKPSPAFFRVAIDRLAAEAAARGEPRLRRSEIVMVGDDVGSDIRGGRRAGLRTIFVRSGKHGDAELAAAASGPRGYAPDAVAASLSAVVAALGLG
jgi:HAD superfamily hydrolase (TIGR01450 family)